MYDNIDKLLDAIRKEQRQAVLDELADDLIQPGGQVLAKDLLASLLKLSTREEVARLVLGLLNQACKAKLIQPIEYVDEESEEERKLLFEIDEDYFHVYGGRVSKTSVFLNVNL